METQAPSVSLSVALPQPTLEPRSVARLQTLQTVAVGILRYGLVFFLVVFGAFKFFAFEAEGIKPLVESSPLLSWLYRLFSVQTASSLLGVFEIGAGALIALRRLVPRVSGFASVAASAIFMTTLSFLVTTPGILAPSNPMGGFILKDLMLLGAALFTASEALLAANRAPAVEAKG